MESGSSAQETWNESASADFIEFGDAFVPWRETIAEAVVDLIPGSESRRRHFVELGIGTGWLAEAVLEGHPAGSVLGLDGSPAMLDESRRRLDRFDDRLELRQFRLQDSSWIDQLAGPVDAFYSCLVIHHLDAEAKRRLYRRLFEALQPRGALLIADIIEAETDRARAYYAASYDQDVLAYSIARTGTTDGYDRFVEMEWNLFRYPDPVDQPSAIAQHLRWLDDAGFEGVDVFWARAGHALYGGYKP